MIDSSFDTFDGCVFTHVEADETLKSPAYFPVFPVCLLRCMLCRFSVEGREFTGKHNMSLSSCVGRLQTFFFVLSAFKKLVSI